MMHIDITTGKEILIELDQNSNENFLSKDMLERQSKSKLSHQESFSRSPSKMKP